MSNGTQPSDSIAEPQKPYKPHQFTVRTFFAAAVWLSLLLTAINTLEDEGALGTAVALLAWIAFAELYRRFRATRAMVALCGGPIVLLVIWSAVLMAIGSHGGRVLPPVPWFPAFALAWGMVLSVVVAIERAVDRWVLGRFLRRRNSSRSEGSGDSLPAPRSVRLRCAAMLVLIHTMLGLVALWMLLGPRRPRYSDFQVLGLAVVAIVDLPILPVYDATIPGFRHPHDTASIVSASLVFGGALYGAVGLLIGHVAERFRRKGLVSGPPKPASRESPPDEDGQEP